MAKIIGMGGKDKQPAQVKIDVSDLTDLVCDQCGAKVFKRSIVPLVYGEAFLSKWLFDVEIFLRLKKHLGKENTMKHIFEQPLMRWIHVDDSKLGMRDALEIPGRLTQIWLNYSFSNRYHTTLQSSNVPFELDSMSREYSIAA